MKAPVFWVIYHVCSHYASTAQKSPPSPQPLMNNNEIQPVLNVHSLSSGENVTWTTMRPFTVFTVTDQSVTKPCWRRRRWHPTPVLLTEEPGGLQSMGSLRVGHNWATLLSLFTFMHWRRKWQPTPVFLPGESQGRGSLVRIWLYLKIKLKSGHWGGL